MSYSVYQLTERGKPRYVGVTHLTLSVRLRQHLRDKAGTYKVKWLQKCLRNNIKVSVELLDCDLSVNEAFLLEQHYIRRYRREGVKLTNATIGGEGVVLLRDEAKEQMIRGLRKHHEVMRTAKKREEQRQKMLTMEWTPERRKQQQEVIAKVHQSDKWKKANAAALRKRNAANWANPDWKEMMRKKLIESNRNRGGKPRAKRFSLAVKGQK